MTSDTIDYFMGLPDGANYVVLYQMLCLKTINTDGRLSRQIGEIIIPYDIPKIQRDLKWFSADTIRVALGLYKSFGLIYVDGDGVLVLADHDSLVGSETDSAARMRNVRAGRRSEELPQDVTTGAQCAHIVTPDIDKDIDIRERDKISDKDKETIDVSDETSCGSSDFQKVIEAWNSLGLQTIKKITSGSTRSKLLRARIKEYGLSDVLAAVEKVRASDFLMGQTGNGWQATFDWFIKPNNFPKVLSGNYDPRRSRQQQGHDTDNPFLQMLGGGG
jgi:hypothetical protein